MSKQTTSSLLADLDKILNDLKPESMPSLENLWMQVYNVEHSNSVVLEKLLERIDIVHTDNNLLVTNSLTGKREESRKVAARAEILRKLSADLSGRVESEMNASQASIEDQRRQRNDLTNGFSDTISELSTRLQTAGQLRNAVDQQKQALIAEIHKCLAEMTELDNRFESEIGQLDQFGKVVAQTLKDEVANLDDTAAMEQEKFLMSEEDHLIQSIALTTSERALRVQLYDYSSMFDALQVRLEQDKQQYMTHHTLVAQLNTRIKTSEKANAQLTKKCTQIELKNLPETQGRLGSLEADIRRQQTAVAKYNALIAAFESDISKFEQ